MTGTDVCATTRLDPTERVERHRERLHRALASVAVAVLPWLIAPGMVQPDTKIDLVVSPWRYLGRALGAWNSHAGLGELQNQAYGYLFPMGPVFGVCHSLGLPGWAAQRVWWTILLLVAFLGAERLIRRMRVAGPGPALLGGAAYALSPRVLTVLSEVSVAAWPLALAPWLVLAARPLLEPGATRSRLVRAAAVTGLLTVTLGGVNATASGMALVLPFCYLLTHPVGRRRLLWWCAGVLLGGLWWLLPLLVLGRYAYPFLDYIETSSITTAVTSAPNALRGASHWVAYILDGADHPTWQAGWVLAQSVVAIVATCAVAAAGAWGLLRRRRDHVTLFALTSVLVGALIMVVGHAGVIGSPVSEPVRTLLDGPLAPLRNVHKADPLIRLPLVLGLVALAQYLLRRPRVWMRAGVAALTLLVAVAMTPLWQGREADPGDHAGLPHTWQRIAQLVDQRAADHGGSTLLLPGSRTPTYTWGSTSDEPLTALATSPVVYRAAAPLGHPGSTRLLDAADVLATSGRPQPALAPGLARMGIARVVIRHDLADSVGARPWQRVEQTLRRSPGFTHLRTVGHGDSAVTLWQVDAPRSPVTAYTLDSTVKVAGGPEAAFLLLADGVLDPRQGMDLVTGSYTHRAQVITDGMPWRVYNDGVPVARAYGPTLPASDSRPTRIGSRQLPPGGSARTQPSRVLHGMTDLRVSSSAADPFAEAYRGAGAGPAAAFDDDPGTAWLTGDQKPTASLSFTLDPRVKVHRVVLHLAHGQGVDLPGHVEVRVGGTTQRVAVKGRTEVAVDLPSTTAGEVSIVLRAPSGASEPVMGLRGLRVPGATLSDVIAIPTPVDPGRQTVVLHRDPRQRVQGGVAGEDPATLRRQVTFDGTGAMTPTVWLRPMPGPRLDHLVDEAGQGGSISLACGEAGSLRIGDRSIPYAVKTTRAAVRDGARVRARLCTDHLSVSTGTTQIAVTPASGLQAQLVTLTPRDAAAPAGGGATAYGDRRTVKALDSSPSHRVIEVGPGPASTIALDEGFNAGWQATTEDGRTLSATTVDGWRQGFDLRDGGAHTLTLTFAPTRTHRIGLVAGLVAVLLLLVGVLLTWSRGRRPTELPAEPEATFSTGLPQPAVWLVTAAVAGLASGGWGVLIAVGVCLVPRRWLATTGAVALALAGVVMATLGVADVQSAGAIIGQLLGTVTLAALARAATSGIGSRDQATSFG